VEGEEVYRRRWWILAVLCLSVVIVQLGNLILIVALPTIQQDLGASPSELQWMVDAYTLVFAALLFTSGSLGDRFGRKLSLAAAIQVAQQVGGPAGGQLAVAAREAFVEGMGVATLTAVGLMLAAAMVAAITLPNKAEHPGLMTERAGPVMNSNQLRSSERS